MIFKKEESITIKKTLLNKINGIAVQSVVFTYLLKEILFPLNTIKFPGYKSAF